MTNSGAELLSGHILKEIEDLSPSQKLVNQCYDGASVMSGHISGVQKRIRDQIDTALYVHCMSHEVPDKTISLFLMSN